MSIDKKKTKNKKRQMPEDDVYEKLKGKKEDQSLSRFDLEGELTAIQASDSSEPDFEDAETT